MSPRSRLDVWLVERGYFATRQQAQRAIQAGEVKIDGLPTDKPGTQVAGDLKVEIQSKPAFVSRGGEKLLGALQTFGLAVAGRIALDAGVSTGGFTDCLLQKGVRQVYGVDVGYGQLAWSLRTDPRVILRERTNLRHLTPISLYGETCPATDWASLATLDLSFISLTKILPPLHSLLIPPREVLLLVKPQFEAGKGQVGKHGVVKDSHIQAAAIGQVLQTALSLGWHYHGLTWSPLVGPAGNLEFWLWLQDNPGLPAPTDPQLWQVCQQAKEVLTNTKIQEMSNVAQYTAKNDEPNC
ncbi:MAG: TlyA family RNA methyltransferase [Cyanobacteriota bacterium]|nr:TlyA family RNA methyltransferase [Cyanobacteriota bacterium]